MKWITRQRPKIDSIACPGLIKNFVDKEAKFMYLPKEQVLDKAEQPGATPYDIPGAGYLHDGEKCTFNYIIGKYQLFDPALLKLASIIRGADTYRFDIASQAAGLSYNFSKVDLKIYEALYSWAKYV
jgi:hypothetical protein